MIEYFRMVLTTIIAGIFATGFKVLAGTALVGAAAGCVLSTGLKDK